MGHAYSVTVTVYIYNCLKGVFTLQMKSSCCVYIIYTLIVGFLRHDHFPGYCVDRQVHHDLYREGILSVDRQRSVQSTPDPYSTSAAVIFSYTLYLLTVSDNFTGELLTSVQTHQAPNTCAVVSPCGRFVACAGTFKHRSLSFCTS